MQDDNVKQYLGDTRVINMTFTDESDTAIDITGATVYLTIKEKPTDPDSEAIVAKQVTSHSDAPNGVTLVSVDPADTRDAKAGKFYYDIQLKEASGKVTTINIGRWELIQDVTHAT